MRITEAKFDIDRGGARYGVSAKVLQDCCNLSVAEALCSSGHARFVGNRFELDSENGNEAFSYDDVEEDQGKNVFEFFQGIRCYGNVFSKGLNNFILIFIY